MGRGKIPRVKLESRTSSPLPTLCAECIDIALLREHKFKKADAFIPATRTYTEQYQVVLQASFLHGPDCIFSIVSELLYRVLRIVVVPGYPVVLDKSEQLILIFGNSFLKSLRWLRMKGSNRERLKELRNLTRVSLEIFPLEAVLIDCCHNTT